MGLREGRKELWMGRRGSKENWACMERNWMGLLAFAFGSLNNI